MLEFEVALSLPGMWRHTGPTRKDDLREPHFSSHCSGSVYEVGKILLNLSQIPREQLQGDPET